MQTPLLSFQEAADHSAACEEALMKVVAALQSAHEMLPLSQNEAYVGTYFGRMWFLPGLVWCGFKHIPQEQIKVLSLSSNCNLLQYCLCSHFAVLSTVCSAWQA